VEVLLAVILGAVLGAVVVSALLGRGRPDRRRRVAPIDLDDIPEPDQQLPAEVTDLLAALSSSGIVLDARQSVVACSPTAISHGLVRGTSVSHPPLLVLARRAVTEGGVVEEQLALPRGPRADARRVVQARATHLGLDHILLLVEDRSHAYLVEEVRRDFLANVSHELKTPVGGLMLLAEAVRDARDDPEAVARFAKRMRKETRRLDQLVSDIVQLSRLQSEDRLSDPDAVDLGEVVRQAVDDVRITAEERQIDLVVRSDLNCWVWGDAGLLTTAVRNLVVNAVAYSASGTRVAVRALIAADGAREVIVSDQGQGIPEAEIGRIFERFYRIDAARSRATGGTGLGLSIVKHVCANHGGDVTVWSEVGRGSTFTIRLPAPAYGPDDQSTTGVLPVLTEADLAGGRPEDTDGSTPATDPTADPAINGSTLTNPANGPVPREVRPL
jgi:two-component system sensor histidine kinase SenX3